MKQRIQLYINGILNRPGVSENWTGRAVTHTHNHSDHRAEKIEYFCGIVSRALGQNARAQKLARTLEFYPPNLWDRHLVGHSNGTDVILDALKALNWPRVEALHLVSAACEADFDRNGLNVAMLTGRVGKVYVYVSGKDIALRFARTWPGRWLGYGTLGLHGPLNVSPYVKDRIGVLEWPTYGHSDCFHDEAFNQTMKHFLQ